MKEPMSAKPAEAPAIETRVLDTIRRIGGEPLLGAMVSGFVRQSRKRLEKMREAWVEGELSAIAETAESLRSAGEQLGAGRVAALCRAIEREAFSGETRALPRLLHDLETELERASAALEQVAVEGSPGPGLPRAL